MPAGQWPRRGPRSAVAVRYEVGKDRAPRVVAKGKGVLAERILDLAKQHNVPVHEDPELLEALARLDVQDEIPPELYQVMAEVLTFIYKANKKKAAALPRR
jgi:flagellar biosynthesis protein